MKENRPSITAAGIAVLRGLESEKPAGERICYDPYAWHFAFLRDTEWRHLQ